MAASEIVSLPEVSLARLGVAPDQLDGAFVLLTGAIGLLVSLRGPRGGTMPAPGELRLGQDLPPRLLQSPVQVFVRRGDRALVLGPARLGRRAQRARDGFAISFILDEVLSDSVWQQLVSDTGAHAPRPPAPEEGLARLGATSTTDDRIAAMNLFVERWYGPPTLPAPGLLVSERVPRPLRAFQLLAVGRTLCSHNQMVSPPDLTIEEGKIIFYVENQGVCLWATDPDADDPPVFVRDGELGAPWRKDAGALSDFLLGVVVQEATFGAPFTATHDGLERGALARLTRRVPALPISSPLTQRKRYLAADGLIGFVLSGADHDGATAWLGAKDALDLATLDELEL